MEIDEEFRFAKHMTEIEVLDDGDAVMTTTTPACDFCMDTRIVWEYPCRHFVIPQIGFGSDDNWLACERCAEFIEGRFLPNLTVRSLRSWAFRFNEIDNELIDRIGLIQQGFFEHQNGPRFRAEEGL